MMGGRRLAQNCAFRIAFRIARGAPLARLVPVVELEAAPDAAELVRHRQRVARLRAGRVVRELGADRRLVLRARLCSGVAYPEELAVRLALVERRVAVAVGRALERRLVARVLRAPTLARRRMQVARKS